MDLRVITVPYDSGRRDERMGAGPARLLAAGVLREVLADGHRVESETVVLPDDAFPTEVASAFALGRALAARVALAVAEGALPVVLAGNCVSSLGTLAGLGEAPVGVLWFDAHGDFNTPETTVGGFVDGMALSIATGQCWRPLAMTVPGFRPVDERRVTLVGTRDLDAAEAERLERSAVTVVPTAALAARLPPRLAALGAEGASGVYLHVDLDVLDPSEGRANGYAVPGGLTVAELAGALAAAAAALPVRAIAFTAYDPSVDPAGRVVAAAARCLAAAVGPAARNA